MARILVIDDDPVIRKIIATILGRQRHQVVAASDGREGLAPEFSTWVGALIGMAMSPRQQCRRQSRTGPASYSVNLG